MSRVVAQRARSAGNDGKVHVEGEPRGVVRREIRRCGLRRGGGGERYKDKAGQDAAGKHIR
jgi:hypothetical protein